MTTSDDAAPISRTTIAAAITAGSIGILILGVQPVLFSPLVQEHRVTESGAGYLATIEVIAIAIGSVLGVPLLRRLSPRTVAIVGGALLALINVLIVGHGSVATLLFMRGLTGLIGGVLVAIGVVAAVKSVHPERVAALFLALQTMLQLVVAAIMPRLEWHGSRADAGFLALAATSLVAILAAAALPPRMRPAPPAPGGGAISLASGVVLFACATFLGGIVAVWTYFGLWLAYKGYAPDVEANAVALSLGFQVIGALVATQTSERFSSRTTLVVCCVAEACVAAFLLLAASSITLIYVVSAAFGFLWLFATPSFTGLLLAIDPARRAALYIPAAQLAGAAALPTVAALIVGEHDVEPAFKMGIAILVVTAVLIAVRISKRS
jgi:predicted MFS family arabinose efflux permease